MRRSIVLASVVVAAFAATGCKKVAVSDTTTEVPVTVGIFCYPDSIRAYVIPSSVKVMDALVVWTLDPLSNVAEFQVENKEGRKKWPYDKAPPYKGDKNNPAKSKDLKKDAEGKYEYSITATCPTSTGAIRSIVIDPDMIIIWKRSEQQ